MSVAGRWVVVIVSNIVIAFAKRKARHFNSADIPTGKSSTLPAIPLRNRVVISTHCRRGRNTRAAGSRRHENCNGCLSVFASHRDSGTTQAKNDYDARIVSTKRRRKVSRVAGLESRRQDGYLRAVFPNLISADATKRRVDIRSEDVGLVIFVRIGDLEFQLH